MNILIAALALFAAVEPMTAKLSQIKGGTPLVTNETEVIRAVYDEIGSKQPLLTAGANITIDTSTWTISATGGGGGGDVTRQDLIAATNAVSESCAQSISAAVSPLTSYRWATDRAWAVEWCLESYYTPSNTWTAAKSPDQYTAWSNRVVGVSWGGSARCRAVSTNTRALDDAPTNITWSIVGTPHGSIDSDGNYTALSTGISRVRCLDGDTGVSRYADVAVTIGRRETTTNLCYVADTLPDRDAVNDASEARLRSAELVESNAEYCVWSTADLNRYCGGISQGHIRPFAVSPHVLATAAHYGSDIRLGIQTFDDVPVSKVRVRLLTDIARELHFSDAEIARMDIGDIAIVLCDLDGPGVPDNCIPYFMAEDVAERRLGSLAGLTVWANNQRTLYAIPMRMTSNTTWTKPYGQYNSTMPRLDIMEWIEQKNRFWAVRGGDSGKPITLSLDGADVVISHFHTRTSGPNYMRAVPVLRQFVALYDSYTLKEIR